MSKRNIARRSVPFVTTFLIMVIIFMFSAQTAEESSKISRGLTAEIVDILPFTRNLSFADKQEAVSLLHNFIRKSAHFFIYFMLGISSSAMLLSAKPRMKPLKIWILCAVLCCLYAATDETHQLFVSGRGGMVGDVILDTCGSAFGGAVFAAVRRFTGKGDNQ